MIKNKVKKIIVILILIVMLFPYITLAAGDAAQSNVGQALASYAYNFCMKYGANSANNLTIYDHDNGGTTDREFGYRLQFHSGTAQSGKGTKNYTDKIPMDCVGFVSAMIHNALGIGGNSFTYFITPQVGLCTEGKKYFEQVTGTPQPGDILKNGSHVKIYLGNIGNGKNTAHSVQTNFKGAVAENTSTTGFVIYRMAQDLAVSIENEGEIKFTPGGSVISGMGLTGSSVMEESEFYYNGVPDGKYSVAGNFWEWIVQSLMDVFEFLVNIIAYIFRMVPVGFTAIIENLITFVVTSITGEEFDIWDDSTQRGSSGDITVESIIFGRKVKDEVTGEQKTVDIFNVNFFEFDD